MDWQEYVCHYYNLKHSVMDVADMQYLRYANICRSNNMYIYIIQYMYILENGVQASVYINDHIWVNFLVLHQPELYKGVSRILGWCPSELHKPGFQIVKGRK